MLEVRPEELGTVLGGEPGSGEHGEDERNAEDDSYDRVSAHENNGTPLLERWKEHRKDIPSLNGLGFPRNGAAGRIPAT